KEINILNPNKRLYLVSTVKSVQKEFKHYVEIQGTVNSDQSISLYPEIGGLIKKVYVKEGQQVKKDQILVKFDSEVMQRSIKELDTNIDLARTTYKKQKRLWDKKIGSEMQYLQAKSNLESLNNKKASLKAQISQTSIKAQFSGVIDQIFIKQGEMAAPGMPVLRLINLDEIYIEANVSEKYLRHIKKGSEANIYFPNLETTIPAKVSMIGNFINPANRTFRIVVDIKNNDHMIKPNQLAVIKLLDLSKDGVVIPSNVILNSPDGSSYVYEVVTVDGLQRTKKTPIKVGLSYKNETIVNEGLGADALVVDKGSRSIQDNQEVKVEK
ncbi:MAG: efflux RND transporter periplasmic adaptor subunit, partial [Flavobacteriales bacterium]|nr:efflux RND transporter periplasmic adaptor subunit [Flavobacteriales bacterium]